MTIDSNNYSSTKELTEAMENERDLCLLSITRSEIIRLEISKGKIENAIAHLKQDEIYLEQKINKYYESTNRDEE